MNYNYILQRAIEFATECHEGQTRKDKKTPYITHPIAVMEIIENKYSDNSLYRLAANPEGIFAMKILGLFHDIAEDVKRYKDKEAEIIHDFNRTIDLRLNSWVIEALITNLKALNKNRHKNYLEFILAIKNTGLFAKETKLADLQHNMSDLQEGSLKDKYRLAEYILTN